MIPFDIYDSHLDGKSYEGNDLAHILFAIDRLNEQFEAGDIQILHLGFNAPNPNLECPLWYTVDKLDARRSSTLVTGAKVYSSHYIGNITIKVAQESVRLQIQPRFVQENGEDIFNHILGCACNVFIPKGLSSVSQMRSNNYWLIGLLWKALLEKALSFGQIPKEYKSETRNIKRFKGRLDVPRHIRFNIVNQSRFYCTYRKLTMDNTINRTIRKTISILCEKGLSGILSDIIEYDNKLDSFGVSDSDVQIYDIDSIRYSSLNYIYKPVMEMSRAILGMRAAEFDKNSTASGISYFIDMAELWELYLTKVLQNRLDNNYRVFSPNITGGFYYLENGMRSIRPDILIEKDGEIVLIIDAKYKDYHRLGTTDNHGNISREDLYQMSTYLHHFGKAGKKITGLFTSPAIPDNQVDVHCLSNNSYQRIGLVNLNIKEAMSIGDLIDAEKEYVNHINTLLKQ